MLTAIIHHQGAKTQIHGRGGPPVPALIGGSDTCLVMMEVRQRCIWLALDAVNVSESWIIEVTHASLHQLRAS